VCSRQRGTDELCDSGMTCLDQPRSEKSLVRQGYPPLGTSSHAVTWVSLDIWLGWTAVSLLECAYACHTKICPPSGWRRPPGRPSRLGCPRLVMALQPPSAKNGTLQTCSQSDVAIPGERNRRYGHPPPKRYSDDDDDE